MSDKAPHEALRESRPCAVCGQQFRPKWPKGTYCSSTCRAQANQARRPGKKQGGPSKIDIAPPKES